MKNLDRILTGAVLLIASSFGVLAVAVFFLEIGKAEGVDGGRGMGLNMENRDVFVQGNWKTVPKGEEEAVCPVVLTDGTLAPKFRYTTTLDHRQEGVALFLSPYPLVPRRPPQVRFDYRRKRSDAMPEVPKESWIYSPELGLIRTDKDHQVEGWLTDDGWSTTPRVCESFRKSIAPPLVPGGERPWFQRYNFTRERFLVYLTPEGLYRADLELRRIERVASIEGAVSTFPGMGASSFYPRAYLVTKNRIHWIDPVPTGGYGTIELSARLAGRDDLLVAAGTEDRVIVREGTSGSRKVETVPYHVTVLSGRGAAPVEYDYTFETGPEIPGRPSPASAPESWDAILQRTNGGILCQAVVPPAWKATNWLSVRRMKHWQERAVGLDVDRQMFQGSFWIGLPLPIVLAAFIVRSARRQSMRAAVSWGLFVLAFGLSGALVYWLLGGRRHPSAKSMGEKPKLLGIEILRPVYSPK